MHLKILTLTNWLKLYLLHQYIYIFIRGLNFFIKCMINLITFISIIFKYVFHLYHKTVTIYCDHVSIHLLI